MIILHRYALQSKSVPCTLYKDAYTKRPIQRDLYKETYTKRHINIGMSIHEITCMCTIIPIAYN